MRTIKQAARFTASGGVCFLIDFGLYMLLCGSISYIAASAIAFSLASAANYILTTKYVFKARAGDAAGIAFFFATCMAGLAFTGASLAFFIDALGFNFAAAKLVSIVLSSAGNFVVRKLYFKEREDGKNEMENGNCMRSDFAAVPYGSIRRGRLCP